jgi:hypothetical protein
MNYDKIIRRIRNSPLLFDSEDDHKIHRILKKALSMSRKRRERATPSVGIYSGLTRRELARSGTCEPDWY